MVPFPFTLRLISWLTVTFSGMILLIWRPATTPLPGQQIVYSSSIGQTANTYILNTDASAYDRLNWDGHPLTLSSCSVDGERLAFVSAGSIHLMQVRDGSHWRAPLDEIPFRPVALVAFNQGGLLVASRPGETVYYQPTRDGLLERGSNPLSPGSALAMTPVERFRAHALARTQPPDPDLMVMPPAAHTWDSTWSPDGSLLAYPTLIHGQAAIHLWDAHARLSVQLTFMSGAEYRPTWSPDGQQLAFLTDQVSYADFYTANLSSALPNHLFSTREVYPYLCFLVTRPKGLLETDDK